MVPEDKYSKLDTLRHSCAHVMAHAVKELFPEAKFGIGPPIENGFYYDIDLPHALVEEDLKKIEAKMGQIIKDNKPFVKQAIKRDDAIKHFEKAKESYKVQIIHQVDKADEISTYTEGDFTDLCRGPHVKSAGDIKAFKLLTVSGAYWRGDERNAMMQRIYGTAFFSQKDLGKFLKQREEAKKRDHRQLGTELDLFSLQEKAGQGLIFYHPKGGIIRYLIEQYMREEHLKRGYSFVAGPQILKSDVWKISGHYDFYKENMFIFESPDEREYAIKPMNCPGHMMIFKSRGRSYRELPLRFFEMGNVCRYEKSGVLHGLLRVRNFTQDDAHIFCLPDQLEAEIALVLDFVFHVLKDFGFKDFSVCLSTRPKESIGEDRMWDQATSALKGAMKSKGLKYELNPEGGAFYGPKIDVEIKDAIGRSWQCATIQCDFALPEAFELDVVTKSGKKERPAMVHRAILGSVERFMGCLIEHYAGLLPFWLSPVQVAILPIAKDHGEYCVGVQKELEGAGIRVNFYDSSETLNRRIRLAQNEKIPYTLVAGQKEVDGKSVTARRHGDKQQNVMSIMEFKELCLDHIKHRR